MPSFSETCVTSSASAAETAKPWFCTVTSTRPRAQVAHRMVRAAVAERELERLEPEREAEQLVAEADPEERHAPEQVADRSIGPSSTDGSPGPLPTSTARGAVSEDRVRVPVARDDVHLEPASLRAAAGSSACSRGRPASTRGPAPTVYGSTASDPPVERPAVDRRLRERPLEQRVGAALRRARSGATPPARIRRTSARVSTSASATTPCSAQPIGERRAGRVAHDDPSHCTRSDSMPRLVDAVVPTSGYAKQSTWAT